MSVALIAIRNEVEFGHNCVEHKPCVHASVVHLCARSQPYISAVRACVDHPYMNH